MKAWTALLIFLPLAAQETARVPKAAPAAIQDAAPAATEAAPTAQETKPAASEAKPAPETAPAATDAAIVAANPEPGLTGSVDVGYRWRSGIEGLIGVLRRVYGFDRCPDHGSDGVQRWVGLGVLTANLVTIARYWLGKQD